MSTLTLPEGMTRADLPVRVNRAVGMLLAKRQYNSDEPLWERVVVEAVKSEYPRLRFFGSIYSAKGVQSEEIEVVYWRIEAVRREEYLTRTSIHGQWCVPAKGRTSFIGGQRYTLGGDRQFRSERDFESWAGI